MYSYSIIEFWFSATPSCILPRNPQLNENAALLIV
jgi:hypothetical protein